MQSNTKFKPENNTVKLSSVSRYYGNFKGIEDINISVQKGEIFGLLGTNGAGKTTILRIIMGLIKPTKGTISIFGRDLAKSLDKTKIGYLQGDYSTYNEMKVKDLLYFINKIKNTNIDNSNNLCERFSLNQERKIGELSKGNKQKLGIVQAFMSNPDLLLLDEPTSGLDPMMQQEFQNLILETQESGKTIIMSSHIITEIENTCSRVAIVQEGNLITTENVSNFTKNRINQIKVVFEKQIPLNELKNLEEIINIKVHKNKLTCEIIGSPNNFIELLSKNKIIDLTIQPGSIEDFFMSTYLSKSNT